MSSQSNGAVTDRHIVAVLRPVVHGTRPVLGALRDSDPFGLRRRMLDNLEPAEAAKVDTTGVAEPGEVEGAGDTAGGSVAVDPDDAERGVLSSAKNRVLDWVSAVHVPGTPAWAAMNANQRTSWWVSRVGRFTALLAAVPGIGGALADRLPVQDALGAAGQALLLCAIAGEHGIRDEDDQIRLLAHVLFQRDVDEALAAARSDAEAREAERAEAERRSEELTAELAESKGKHGRVTLKAVAGTVWRIGRMLWGLGDELGKRPQGRWYHQALGMLPLVGMAGDYLGERSALKRVAKAARHWIETRPAAQ